jgi:hypothetical protein
MRFANGSIYWGGQVIHHRAADVGIGQQLHV